MKNKIANTIKFILIMIIWFCLVAAVTLVIGYLLDPLGNNAIGIIFGISILLLVIAAVLKNNELNAKANANALLK